MISEGTDIPRLQVCCYLSRIRTELHYRQVLGRVIRRTGETDNQAWLFMLAEPTLQSFAERIAEDLPGDLAVLSQVELPSEASGQNHSATGASKEPDGISSKETGASADGSSTYELEYNLAVAPSYQVSFSQYYRKLLLGCF